MKINKYIVSIVLLALFLLPSVYKSAHIIINFDNHKHFHCSCNNDNDEDRIEKKESENYCLICDYEIFVYDVSKNFIRQLNTLERKNIFYQEKTLFYSKLVYSIKTPRAPPSLSIYLNLFLLNRVY